MKIALAPKFESRLRRALREAGRREIGGMLFAEQIAPAHFRLMDFSIDALSGSDSHFQRDPIRHQNACEEFFNRTGYDFTRFNYLGEWHSHPSFSVRPSFEDIETMQSIVETKAGPISFAVLLIVKLRLHVWMDHSLTAFVRGYSPQPARIASRFI